MYGVLKAGRSSQVRPWIMVISAIYVEDGTPWRARGPTQGLGSWPPINRISRNHGIIVTQITASNTNIAVVGWCCRSLSNTSLPPLLGLEGLAGMWLIERPYVVVKISTDRLHDCRRLAQTVLPESTRLELKRWIVIVTLWLSRTSRSLFTWDLYSSSE